MSDGQPDIRSDFPLRHTRAVVDLEAIEANLHLLAERVPGSGLVPAVKADAYGHGVEAVAAVCERWGATMLAVANLQEFLYLRDCGISLPVLVLEDLFADEMEAAIVAGARLSVGSLEYARSLSAAARRGGSPAVVHVNVDTGMGRMGLFSDTPAAELRAIAGLEGIEIEGVFSHFPGSDEGDPSVPRRQIQDLQAVLAAVAEQGLRPRYRHIANSGALIDLPEEVAWDLVRPGVAMYGMYPSREVDHGVKLQPALRWESRLVKITRYHREWTVGYGQTYPVKPGSVIGIVPVGYGDGYPRSLSNRGSVLVSGRRVPIAGRVSMDMIAVDLTDLSGPGNDAPVLGQEVVLLGAQGDAHIDAAEIADLTGTITYEVTCDIAARVPRIYTRGGTPVAFRSVRTGYRTLV
jgi:alanine racemase